MGNDVADRGLARFSAIISALLFFVASIFAAALFTGPFTNVILFFSLFILLLYGRRAAMWYAIIGSFVLDTVTPFPPYVILCALIIAVFGTNMVLTRYITHRALMGAIAVGIVGVILYEFGIIFFAYLGDFFIQGFKPIIHRAYGIFFLERIMVTSVVLAVVFWITRRISPSVRGVMLQ